MPLKKKLKSKLDEGENEEEELEESSSESIGSEDEDDDEDEEDEDQNEEIMIDFEARALLESDMESVQMMVKQKFANLPVNADELARIVVQQDNLGNVIYQAQSKDDDDEEEEKEEETNADDDTIFGVLSAVDLASPKTKSFSTGFVSFLQKQATDSSLSTRLGELFQSKRCLYVVNERYVNIPPGISIPMFEDLLKDIDSSAGDESQSSASTLKNFDYWVFLAKYYVDDDDTSNRSEKIYANAEEEVFDEFSEIKYELKASGPKGASSSGDDSLKSHLKVLIIHKDKINDALQKVKSLLN